MKVGDQYLQSIWLHPEHSHIVQIIDQRSLPHQLIIEDLQSVEQVAAAIREMHVRGAPLIGITAAYGVYIACLEAPKDDRFMAFLEEAMEQLLATRPTAVNLAWAIAQQKQQLAMGGSPEEQTQRVLAHAHLLRKESIDRCREIGWQGLEIIRSISNTKQGQTVHILTHCNAGWLACIDYGTATAPMYAAFDEGIDIHIWVDETRPRNQGARLTAWELQAHGIPHTIITDNAGGHLMQHGLVDLVIVGTDRTTRSGDVANKIGTYLKALAAKDNGIPFYVALPSSTIDWGISDGLREIPIEERGEEEVKYIQGWQEGAIKKVLLSPAESPAANFAFDVTPARLVTGLITEFGVCAASEESLAALMDKTKS